MILSPKKFSTAKSSKNISKIFRFYFKAGKLQKNHKIRGFEKFLLCMYLRKVFYFPRFLAFIISKLGEKLK